MTEAFEVSGKIVNILIPYVIGEGLWHQGHHQGQGIQAILIPYVIGEGLWHSAGEYNQSANILIPYVIGEGLWLQSKNYSHKIKQIEWHFDNIKMHEKVALFLTSLKSQSACKKAVKPLNNTTIWMSS